MGEFKIGRNCLQVQKGEYYVKSPVHSNSSTMATRKFITVIIDYTLHVYRNNNLAG